MKRIKIILLLNLILIVSIYSQGGKLPVVMIPSSVRRGNPLDILVFLSDSVSGILVEMLHGKTVVLKTKAFYVGTTKNRRVWLGMLGIPSYIEQGVYSIAVTGEGGVVNFNYRAEIKVINVYYIHERIALSSSLTELRKRKDPLVKKQTEDLIKILFKFDSSAVFNLGIFHKPVNGIISSHFGDRRMYSYSDGETAQSIHNGIDFAVPVGTKVHACGDGMVVFADNRIVTGNSVIIEHLPEVYSIYYHLSKIKVKRGQIVKRDDIIGKSGVSGLATGPHLHWEVRVSGVAVDPEIFLKNKIIDKNDFLSNILEQ